MDAARGLFETEGYSSSGLEAVAKKAGVSRQAIYLHFASRADLLRSLHTRVNEQDVEPAFRRVWESPSAAAALDAWAEASAEAIPKIIGLANALDAPRHTDPEVDSTWKAPAQGHYADCLRLARWLKRDGQLPAAMTTATAADILWSMTSIRAYESLVVQRRWSPQRWVLWIQSVLRQLLTSKAPIPR